MNESNKSATNKIPIHSWRTDVKPICDIGLLDLSGQLVIVGQTEKHFPVGSTGIRAESIKSLTGRSSFQNLQNPLRRGCET